LTVDGLCPLRVIRVIRALPVSDMMVRGVVTANCVATSNPSNDLCFFALRS